MSYTYEALSPGGHQEMLEEVFSKVREQVGSYKTAEGSLVSFDDGADLPMPSFICNIDAVQDLHGYDAPWVGGAGKNKWEFDSSLSGNGNLLQGKVFTNQIAAGAYTLSCKGTFPSGGAMAFRFIYTDDTTKDVTLGYNVQSGTYYVSAVFDKAVRALSYVYSNNANNSINSIMLEVGNQATNFAPYSNICPIEGWSEADVTRCGKNLLDVLNPSETGYTFGIIGGEPAKIQNSGWGILNYVKTVEGVVYTYSGMSIPYNTNTTVIEITNTNKEFLQYMIISTPEWQEKGFTFTSPTDGYVRVAYKLTDTYNQLEIGSPATSYKPYQGQTIQVSWQTEAGEVFGGYVDLVSGELTATHKSQTGFTRGSQDSSNKLYNIGTIADIKAYTNASAISPYFVDSMFEKLSIQGARAAETPSIAHYNKALYVGGYIGKEAELGTLLESLQVKYELETPITYQLTPTQIKSLLGNNNAWCDTGAIMSLQYQPNNIIAELRSEILSLQEWGFSPIIYSTVEREVGVWTDNKPLYQCSFLLPQNITVQTTWTSTDINLSNYNIENLVYCETLRIDSGFWIFNANVNDNILRLYSYQNISLLKNSIVTIRYTKTTDVAGSGKYNTLGVPTVHYTTDEQVIGTYLGETLYQKTWIFETPVAVSSSNWIATPALIGNISKVISATANNGGDACWQGNLQVSANTNGGNQYIKLQACRNTGDTSVKELTLQYIKTT